MIGLLVGIHFRPPAKLLLAELQSGQELWLRAEPDNPYDAEAMQTWLATQSLDREKLALMEEPLAGMGFTPEDILAQPEWQLGYLAREGNKALAKIDGAKAASAFTEGAGLLLWGPNGEALVRQEPKA